MTSTRDRRSHATGLARGALLAALAGSLAACGGETESESAVRDAAIVLTTGDGSGRAAESMGELRESRYNAVVTELSSHVSKDGFGSAAAVLSGVANQGLAAEAYSGLVADLAGVRDRMMKLRGSTASWRTHRALAEAAATFDPQPRIAALDELSQTLSADLDQARRVHKLVSDQIGELESRIAEAESKAAEERNVAGELTLQSNTMPAAEAAQMAERIREHTRRADRYEFEAQRLRTRADQLRPDATEKNAHTERIEAQLALVEDSRRDVAERTQASGRQRADAQQNADQTRGEILEQVDEIEAFIANELEDSRSGTERALREASSNAGRAGEATRDSARLISASASQRLGEMHESVAAAHASVADAYEHMIEIGLDNDGALARLAEAHRRAESEARDAATDAFASAAGSLRQVRVRGETKDRLNALADRLEGLEPEASPEEFGAEPYEGFGDLDDESGKDGMDPADDDGMTDEDVDG